MINRIIEIRKKEGLSQEQFAKRLGLSRSFINQVETGKKNISDRTISDICQEFHINEEWLREGTEPMDAPISEDCLWGFYDLFKCNHLEAKFLQSYFNLSERDRRAFCELLLKMFPESFSDVEHPFERFWQVAPPLSDTTKMDEREKAGDLYVEERQKEEKPDTPASSANGSAVG